MAKCGCKIDAQVKSGGSLASTSVVEFVPCDAWSKVESTNMFGGNSDLGDFRVVMEGGKNQSKPKSKNPSSRWRKIKMPKQRGQNGGNASCDAPAFTPSYLSTTGNPPAPLLPGSQTSAVFDYSGVGQSVLASLQTQATTGSLLPSQVYIPQGATSLGMTLYP